MTGAKGVIRTPIAQGFNLPLYRWSYLGKTGAGTGARRSRFCASLDYARPSPHVQ